MKFNTNTIISILVLFLSITSTIENHSEEPFKCSLSQNDQDKTCTGISILCEEELIMLKIPSLLRETHIIRVHKEEDFENILCHGLNFLFSNDRTIQKNECSDLEKFESIYGKVNKEKILREIRKPIQNGILLI